MEGHRWLGQCDFGAKRKRCVTRYQNIRLTSWPLFINISVSFQLSTEECSRVRLSIKLQKVFCSTAHQVISTVQFLMRNCEIKIFIFPGCGKTLIAKATAKEAGMRFINLDVASEFHPCNTHLHISNFHFFKCSLTNGTANHRSLRRPCSLLRSKFNPALFLLMRLTPSCDRVIPTIMR